MNKFSRVSRRKFVGSAISAAAVTSWPVQKFLRFSSGHASDSPGPAWKDEGVLFVDKSPYAKLRNVPVHAVRIEKGFWGNRREINVEKSIPSMEKLLLANGRMDNYLRLAGKSDAPERGPYYSDGRNAATPSRPPKLQKSPA